MHARMKPGRVCHTMARGLRFKCQSGCTECCRRQGFVYLTEGDLKRAAAFLGTSAAAFEQKYVYRTRNLRRLRVPRASYCRFLEDGGCSIHPAKPTQCRDFPFWPELVASRREWRKTERYCPGLGKGPLIRIQAVQAAAREMREAPPGPHK